MNKIEMLNDKVASLIKMYQELKNENESLRNQLIAAQGQNESLMSKTRELEENSSTKDSEIDSILEKLNDIGNNIVINSDDSDSYDTAINTENKYDATQDQDQ